MVYFVLASGLPLPTIREFGLESLVDVSSKEHAPAPTQDAVYKGPLVSREEAEREAMAWEAAAAPWFKEPVVAVVKGPSLAIAARKFLLVVAIRDPNPAHKESAIALHRHFMRRPRVSRLTDEQLQRRAAEAAARAAQPAEPAKPRAPTPSFQYEAWNVVAQSGAAVGEVRRFVASHDLNDQLAVREVQQRWIVPLAHAIEAIAADEIEALELGLGAKRTEEERGYTRSHLDALRYARRNLAAMRLLCCAPEPGEAGLWPWAEDSRPPSLQA